MTEQIKVLFLPRWYPHRFDPMTGLFIQRQAEAVSAFCEVAVLYAHPVAGASNKFEIDISRGKNIHVIRVYYKVPEKKIPGITQILKHYMFFRAYILGFRMLRKFRPDLLHIHILTRHGILGWGYKLLTKTPYLISEHWSRYFRENGSYKGFFRKFLTRRVIKNSSVVIAVSGQLKKAMQSHGLHNDRYYIVPNVVDFEYFKPCEESTTAMNKQIIHVSCFEDKSKNISGFLKILKQLSVKRRDFECRFIGKGPDLEKMQSIAEDLGIKDVIAFFPGLKEGNELVQFMSKADFLVLSSHYETFGTVVVESLACGVPVVATNVGIVPEIVNDSNGMIVSDDDPEEMVRAVDEMLYRCRSYDKMMIRAQTFRRFNSATVGKQIVEIYQRILKEAGNKTK